MRCSPLALFCALTAVGVAGSGCPAPEPPPLKGVQVATITGGVFVENPARESIAGAVVSVLGTPASDVSEVDKQFVLDSIPLGVRRVSIVQESLGRAAEFDVELESPFQTLTLDPALTTLLRSGSVTGTVAGFAETDRPQVFLVGGASQVALVAGDGSFRLDNLPPGDLTIGVAAPGFGLISIAVTVAEGEVKALDPVSLATTNVTGLKLSGRVQLTGETDHTGTTVILNGGQKVVGSDADGAYEFDGLAPGLFEVRAQRAGFRSVVMGTVAIDDDGAVTGLFDAFLAPGEDVVEVIDEVGEGEGEGEAPATVDIVFPAPNDAFPGGAPVVFAADVENADGTTLVWSLADALGDNAVDLTARGATIVADLPVVDVDTFVTVIATLPGGESDAVIIRVQPPIVAEVQAAASLLGVALPDSEPLVEGGVLIGSRLTLQQGHPADVRPADGLTAVWTEQGGGAFQNVLPLSTLPVGTHRFSGVITTADGQQGSVIVEVVVLPLVFSIVIAEPNDQQNYFVDTGLPLRATVSHGWQTAFLSSSVSWRLPSGLLVGAGLTTAAQGVAGGADVVTVECIDLVGNRVFATVPFQLDAVQFSAFFNSPPLDSTFQTATPIRVNVGFDHNRLSDTERAAAFVQVLSDRVGLLTMDNGASNLTPATDFFISDLPEGRHTLTARVFAGGRIAQTTTTVTLQSKFVSSTLVTPVRDLVAIEGEAVAMSVAASGGNGAIPQVRWFMDGVEFPANWPGYGTDPAAVARRSLSLGVFDPDVFPFNDTAVGGGLIWSDGPHIIEVGVAADDVDAGAGCINLGTRAQCRSFNVQVARNVRVINSLLTIGAGQTEVFDGVVRMQANVNVNGGSLTILPGTRVLFDMRDLVNPALQTGNANNRRIIFTSGVLRIGEGGAVTPVVIETLKSFAVTNRWSGIFDQGGANVERSFFAQNVVIRDATRAIDLEDIDMNSNARQLVIEDVIVEDSDEAIFAECPTSMERVTVRRTLSGRSAMRLNLTTGCPTTLAYSDIAISGASHGLLLDGAAQPTTITLTNLDITASTSGLDVQTNVSVDILDSRFAGLTSTFPGNASLTVANADDVRVRRTTFENSTFAMATTVAGLRSLDVRSSTFRSLTRGLTVRAADPAATIELHGCVFDTVGLIASYETGNRDLIEMQGNFIGSFTDAASAARAVKAAPAGSVPTVIAQVTDHMDNLTSLNNLGRMRLDNPLPTETLPLAVIREPNESEPWNLRQCIPFVALPLDDTFDVDANCEFRLGPPGGAAAQATPVVLDNDGCLSGGSDGTFDVHLVCDAGGGTETVHSSRLLIDSTRFAGPIHPAGDTWSGTIVVDGDVVVPAGVTLTVAPDAIVRMAASDRSLHKRPTNTSGQFNDARLRGALVRVDFFVEGAVSALDDGGAPIRFIANAGLQRNTWSGFLLTSGAAVALHNVDVESTVSGLTAEANTNASLVPTFDLRETTFRESNTVASGVCPPLVTDLTVENCFEVYTCRMSEPTEVDGAVLDNISQPNAGWFSLDDSPGSITPSFTARDVTGIGNPTNRRQFVSTQFGTGRVELVNITLDDVSTVVETSAASQSIEVSGIDLTTFTTAFVMGDDEILSISDSVFRSGAGLVDNNLGRITMTRSRTVAVTTPFRDTAVSNTVSLDITGNQFEDAGVVFDFGQGFANAGAAGFTLTGNNFLRTTTRVLRLTGGQANSLVGRWDLGGSHFGVASRAAVLPFIEDPRTDSPADANDDNIGRTSFVGFSSTPLNLVVP